MEKHQAVASELQKGNSLFRQGDYEAAMECYRYIADNYKNAVAMTKVGDMYSLGLGTAQDYGAAMAWYKKAADAGDSNAMSKLGDMYRLGWGVEKDLRSALAWYREAAAGGETYAMTRAIEIHEKAAAAGNSYAMFRLGDIYSSGHGGEVDYEKAKLWYRKAAQAGEVRAAHKVINLYKQAANSGDARAMYELGELYASGLEVQNITFSTEWLEKTEDKYLSQIVKYCRKEAKRKALNLDTETARDILQEIFSDDELSDMLRFDEIEREDHGTGMKWFWLEKAADSGYIPAMIRLGTMLLDKAESLVMLRGFFVDYEEIHRRIHKLRRSAFAWFRRAAELGDAYAMNALRWFYRCGLRFESQDETAVKWYMKMATARDDLAMRKVINECENTANAGDRSAMLALGDMYYLGYLVEKDFKKAYRWYKRYSLAGEDTNDLSWLAYSVKWWDFAYLEDETRKEMSFECCYLAAEAGDVESMLLTGDNYRVGYGVEQDFVKAEEYYKKAVAAGDVHAMYALGKMYYSGAGVEENKSEAFYLFEQVIQSSEDPVKDSDIRESIFNAYLKEGNHSNLRALGKLGDLYYLGWGTELNYVEAIKWYEAAGEAGLGSFAKIGDMYRYGVGVDQDYKEARECYERGSAMGEVKAMLALADMYFFGLGVEKDYKKYSEWQEKAEEKIIP